MIEVQFGEIGECSGEEILQALEGAKNELGWGSESRRNCYYKPGSLEEVVKGVELTLAKPEKIGLIWKATVLGFPRIITPFIDPKANYNSIEFSIQDGFWGRDTFFGTFESIHGTIKETSDKRFPGVKQTFKQFVKAFLENLQKIKSELPPAGSDYRIKRGR